MPHSYGTQTADGRESETKRVINTKKVTKKDTQVGFQHAYLHSRTNYQVSMSFSKRVRTEIVTVKKKKKVLNMYKLSHDMLVLLLSCGLFSILLSHQLK